MSDLTHIQPGDKLAVFARHIGWANMPQVDREIATVVRLTKTLAFCTYDNRKDGEFKVRLHDGRKVGTYMTDFVPATAEILAEHESQKAEVRRYRAAANQLGSLLTKSLSNLELTTAQLEKLAAAWIEVQAMKEKK
jgi:IS1 family transposase